MKFMIVAAVLCVGALVARGEMGMATVGALDKEKIAEPTPLVNVVPPLDETQTRPLSSAELVAMYAEQWKKAEPLARATLKRVVTDVDVEKVNLAHGYLSPGMITVTAMVPAGERAGAVMMEVTREGEPRVMKVSFRMKAEKAPAWGDEKAWQTFAEAEMKAAFGELPRPKARSIHQTAREPSEYLKTGRRDAYQIFTWDYYWKEKYALPAAFRTGWFQANEKGKHVTVLMTAEATDDEARAALASLEKLGKLKESREAAQVALAAFRARGNKLAAESTVNWELSLSSKADLEKLTQYGLVNAAPLAKDGPVVPVWRVWSTDSTSGKNYFKAAVHGLSGNALWMEVGEGAK